MGIFVTAPNARARPHRPDRFRRRGHPGSCDARRAASVAVRRAAPYLMAASTARAMAAWPASFG
jgi:hypothetical protein